MKSPNDIEVFEYTILEQLNLRICVLEDESAIKDNEIARLKAEIEELKLRLDKNSKNSHKPPSSDGLKKQPAIPRNIGNKAGGQYGHKGSTLEMVDNPDKVIIHYPVCCEVCNRVFEESEVITGYKKAQVFDIPEPKLEVTEHRLGIITCCGKVHSGCFPKEIISSVQYGPRIKAVSVLLNVDYKIPFDKIGQLFKDLYNSRFNVSTAVGSNRKCYEALESTERTIMQNVVNALVSYFDETGIRVKGVLHWAHVASTTLFTYLFISSHRGKEALESSKSVIKDFKNWTVHDCWTSYFDFKDCQHVICNAHLLRELQALIETGTKWAIEMKSLLLELNKETKDKLIQDQLLKDVWKTKYLEICGNADQEEPPPIKGKRGKPKNTKGRNLLNRLINYQEGILAFAFNESVPFTNNQAERDIRHLKIKQKVATSFRTVSGAEQYLRIQSTISTMRKHKMNVFENLVKVFYGEQIEFQEAK